MTRPNFLRKRASSSCAGREIGSGSRRRRPVAATTERITVRDIIPVSVDYTPVLDAMKAIIPVSMFRHHEKLHVSDVVYKCNRYLALIRRLGLNPFPGRLWDTQDVTFTIGNAVHDLIIGRLQGTRPDNLWGRWKCSCGNEAFIGIYTEAKEHSCSSCKQPTVNYNEISVISELHQVIGNVDLLMKFGDHFRVNELKSINKKGFEEVKAANRAKPEHIIQVGMYWYLLRDLGYSLQDKLSIFYVQKDYKPGVVMHEIVLDAHEIERAVYAYLNPTALLASNDLRVPLPSRANDCSSFAATKTKECHLAGTCFSLSCTSEITRYEDSSN